MCYSEAESGRPGGWRCENDEHAQRERRKAERAEKVFEEDPSAENDEARKQAWLRYLETPAGIRELDAKGEKDAAERFRRRRERHRQQVKEFRAKNRKSSSKSKSMTLAEKLAMAENPATPHEEQMKLASQKNQKVLMALARSSEDQEVLRKLALSGDTTPKQLALQNKAVSTETLKSLFTEASASGDTDSLRRIARHDNCPTELYDALAELAPGEIASKEDCPADILFSLTSSKFRHVRKEVAGNLNTDIRSQQVLSADSDANVRYTLAGNPSTDTSILERIRDEDPDFHPRNRAEQALADKAVSMPA